MWKRRFADTNAAPRSTSTFISAVLDQREGLNTPMARRLVTEERQAGRIGVCNDTFHRFEISLSHQGCIESNSPLTAFLSRNSNDRVLKRPFVANNHASPYIAHSH